MYARNKQPCLASLISQGDMKGDKVLLSKPDSVKFGYSAKVTKFEKIFHLKFDATQ